MTYCIKETSLLFFTLSLCLIGFTTSTARAQTSEAIGYVSPGGAGAGKLGEAGQPFSSLQEALAMGAQELRVAPGRYDESLTLSEGRIVMLRSWDGRGGLDGAGTIEIHGDVVLDGGATVTLASPGDVYRIVGDLMLTDGVLALTENVLELDARHVFIGEKSQIQGSNQCGGGDVVRYTGDDQTEVFLDTSENQLNFESPAIEVIKTGSGSVTFDANGIVSTSTGDVAPNNPDELQTPCFALLSGDVELRDDLDVLNVGGPFEQQGDTFTMAGQSSLCDAPCKAYQQTVRVGFSLGGNMVIDDGEFLATGGNVEVFGDFYLGANMASDPGDAHFSLEPSGDHTVVGNFRVGPDTDPESNDLRQRNRYALGGECGVLDDEGRDKGGLFLLGDYHFEGTGDRYPDLLWLQQEQGLLGNVFFVGAGGQKVWQRQDEDAFFCDVIMASRSIEEEAINLQTNLWLNDEGTLTLEHGVIDTDNETFEIIILNPNIETDLIDRNNARRGEGVVELGSRDSYFDGIVVRALALGTTTTGLMEGGYLFPVGAEEEVVVDPETNTTAIVAFFRPLILEFPDDLGRQSLARVDYLDPDERPSFEFDSLVVDAGGGGTLTLDVIGDQFWQVALDPITTFDPNVRVEADGMPNINDVESLRMIQWDCDGTNPRLAGVYESGPLPPFGFFIDGVPNIRQKGLNVQDCQIIGIATNSRINPIQSDPISTDPGRLQLIHDAPDLLPVDVYVDGQRWLDDFAFRTATPFDTLEAGTHTLEIVEGSAADNSMPLLSTTISLAEGAPVVAVVSNRVSDLTIQTNEQARMAVQTPGQTEFFILHDAVDAPAVDLSILDETPQHNLVRVLVEDFAFADQTTYFGLAPGSYNVEVAVADGGMQVGVYRFDLNAFADQTFTLLASGLLADNSFTLVGFDVNGQPVEPLVVTAIEETGERLVAFALHSNYPNPFNPTTTLQIDLPETALVTVEVVDLLGRTVMTLPPKPMEAGLQQRIPVDAGTLASGTYLYRVIARTAGQTQIETGRMTVIK